MADDVYEPQEDSYLLEKYVKKHAKGIVLDIGTGSGIQAMAAAQKAEFVFAVDINQKALEHCVRSVMKRENILCLKSDLFSFFETKHVVIQNKLMKSIRNKTDAINQFDTIIFNPPYLPDDEKDKDIALYGGKEGYEIIEKFLTEAPKYLAENGIILLIFSSFTDKSKVDELVAKNGFKSEELENIHIFFEDIYCYKIERQ